MQTAPKLISVGQSFLGLPYSMPCGNMKEILKDPIMPYGNIKEILRLSLLKGNISYDTISKN